jgi:hypothetical protein
MGAILWFFFFGTGTGSGGPPAAVPGDEIFVLPARPTVFVLGPRSTVLRLTER